MSIPLDNHRPHTRTDDHILDRLVDGELSESERRDVLHRLQTEPDGWRRCAVAFLEAQSWRQTFALLPSSDRRVAYLANREETPVVPLSKSGKREALRFVGRYAAVAASLFVAFALGWAWHGGLILRTPTPLAQTKTPSPMPSAKTSAPSGVEHEMVTSVSATSEEPASSLDAVVKQWEQRGFQAEKQTRVVTLALKDGRKVAVPVEELRLRYIRGRTY